MDAICLKHCAPVGLNLSACEDEEIANVVSMRLECLRTRMNSLANLGKLPDES